MELNTELLKQNKYIVGVSGGCDSMALLSLLKDNYQVIVCHVNYHLREDSDEDQELVESYCRKYNIPCYTKDIREYDQSNFQAQARIIRYDFYREIGLKHSCGQVVLAHHLDDVIETIIMQLMRHNTKGYLGIKPVSKVKGMKVIRPLLKVTKAKILHYCLSNQIPYHDDYTNFMTDFTRDYVRNVLLENYTAKQKFLLLQQATRHNQIISLRDQLLAGDYEEYDLYKKLDYRRYSDYELASLIYYMLAKVVDKPLISEGLIEEIIKQIHSDKPNLVIDLPIDCQFIKEYENIYVLKTHRDLSYSFIYNELVFDEQEFYKIAPQGDLNEGVFLSPQDFPIVIRTYQPGDKIKTSYGTKKVSRLFIDNKIPIRERKTWPILVRYDGEIVLVPNLAKNLEYKDLKPNIFVIKYRAIIKESD